MVDNEAEERKTAIRQFEKMSEEGVRADLDEGGKNISPTYHLYAREWLYALDRKRNERMSRLAMISAFFAGLAALAAIAAAILTSCH